METKHCSILAITILFTWCSFISCSHRQEIPRCYELEEDVERMRADLPKVLEPGITLTDLEYKDTTYTMWYEVDERIVPFDDYVKIKDESKAIMLDSLYFADGETRNLWYKYLKYNITCKYVMVGKHSNKKDVLTITPQEMRTALNAIVDSTDITSTTSQTKKDFFEQENKDEETLRHDNVIVYNYNGKYQITLPNIIELQESELNSVNTEKGKSNWFQIQSNSNRIVFQQKGLNANLESAMNKYCRVIIEYFREDQHNPVYKSGEQVPVTGDLMEYLYQNAKESCAMTKTPLIKFNTPQAMTINGFPVLYCSYKREGWKGEHPPVIVNVYMIYNRYESVRLTFSYRESEREIWKDIHNNIIRTFVFNTIY